LHNLKPRNDYGEESFLPKNACAAHTAEEDEKNHAFAAQTRMNYFTAIQRG
jgi:hypothetical protein